MGRSRSKPHKYPTECQICMTRFKKLSEFVEHHKEEHPGKQHSYIYVKKKKLYG